ncbi:S-adenosyl-L-methionine-dependent methyltransferase [Microthyrium microscopicum]|uniref:S-adenosyl-L-methionine-dependent methyltransferase n=1 Tax=Microthyrium microscopicum TaxID=703497 RepID=A0A6A6UI62_9PEZI|nr:S-adenosyl-L-methionine-dependent methyltransferase [Microthyrium microscopicum]
MSSKDTTFAAYKKDEGKKYSQGRRGYHPNLYKAVIDYHFSTGGELGTLLDVGCGPGAVAAALAPQFDYAIGIDPSEGMIETARSLGGAAKADEPIRYEVSTGEGLGDNLSPSIAASCIDLITVASAAHWIDMSAFWPRAAEILKPGGTIALWCPGSFSVHPDVPNAAAIEKFLKEHEERHLVPYISPGNLLARDLYRELPLPWTLDKPVSVLDKNTFFRLEWDGSNPTDFYAGDQKLDMNTIEIMAGTLSPVVRWREAHPEDVGTERDVVKIQRRELERLLQEGGVEKGAEYIQGNLSGVLMMVKKLA